MVSVYGRIYAYGNQKTYASTTMHRIISDLVPVLDRRGLSSAQVLLGGDFNCTTQWQIRRDRMMDATVFDRLRAHDLVDLIADRFPDRKQIDCFCHQAEAGCAHVRTLRHRDKTDSRPFQCDYLFASEDLAKRSTVALWDSDDVWALSDHCIVSVDFSRPR